MPAFHCFQFSKPNAAHWFVTFIFFPKKKTGKSNGKEIDDGSYQKAKNVEQPPTTFEINRKKNKKQGAYTNVHYHQPHRGE